MRGTLKERLRSSRVPSYGTWISTASPVCLDALQRLGFDWFVIDTEHAQVNPETMAVMVAMLGDHGPVPIVRVGNVDQLLIKQALDSGAEGVVVPLVSTEAQARSAVAFAKYPPMGVRGAAAAAASRYGTDLSTYLRRANSETLVAVQIETREALEHLDAIAAVPGIDLLFVGPQDLTLSLGLGDDRSHPQVREAMRRVVDACERYDRIPGTLAASREEKAAWTELGFRFIALASDVRFLIQGARDFLGGGPAKGGPAP